MMWGHYFQNKLELNLNNIMTKLFSCSCQKCLVSFIPVIPPAPWWSSKHIRGYTLQLVRGFLSRAQL